MRRVVRILAVVLLASGLTVAVGVAPAYANASCRAQEFPHVGYDSNQWKNNHPGQSEPYSYEGAYSAMSAAGNRTLCVGQNNGYNFSTAWTMWHSVDGGGLAQVGTDYDPSQSCPHFFAEVEHDSGDNVHDFFGNCAPHDNSFHLFTTHAIYASGAYHVQVSYDGTTLFTSGFNPFLAWNTPYGVAWNGEASFAESNVPGSSAAKTEFSDMQVETYDNNFQDACGHVALNARNEGTAVSYSTSSSSCDDTFVWTT